MKKRTLVACFLLLIASVFGESKPITFTADRMSGAAGKKNAVTVLEGNAVAVVGSLRISGARIELSGKDFRNVTAVGGVVGSDEEKGFSFTATELTYDREREVATFKGDAKLNDTKNSVEASASVISYNQKTETAFFQVDVKLTRKNIQCSSGFALYRRTLSLLDLSGSPVVNRDGDEFKADRIGVNLDTENITLDGTVSGSLKEKAKDDAAKADETKTDAAKPDAAKDSADKSGEAAADGTATADRAKDDKSKSEPATTEPGKTGATKDGAPKETAKNE